jgi:RNA polymerase sigma-70 factor (ECF subfamily)
VAADRKLDKSLEQLREELRRYGQSRFPQLRNEIDDLVNQTLFQLWQYTKGSRSQERSPPGSAIERDSTVRRIAFTIFKRRAVDAYRKSAKEWAVRSDLESADQQTSPDQGAERSALLKQMLRVCIAELADMTSEDRALLAELSEGGPRHEAVSARDRQRLKRIRQRLATAISQQLGESAAKLLREAF